jgi:hypothetical protein
MGICLATALLSHSCENAFDVESASGGEGLKGDVRTIHWLATVIPSTVKRGSDPINGDCSSTFSLKAQPSWSIASGRFRCEASTTTYVPRWSFCSVVHTSRHRGSSNVPVDAARTESWLSTARCIYDI